MNSKRDRNGFSLIEVMIFITLLNVVFVASASFVIGALYRMKINEHKTRAVYYAEELQEWLGGEREADWAGLWARAGGGAGISYCVNQQLNLDTTFSDNPFPAYSAATCRFDGIGGNPPQIFRRRLTLIQIPPSQIRAVIEVSWNEISPNGGQIQFTETVESLYTVW